MEFTEAFDAAMTELDGDGSNLPNEVEIAESSSEPSSLEPTNDTPGVDAGSEDETPQSVKDWIGEDLTRKEAYEQANRELMRNKTNELQIAAKFKGMDPEDAALLALAYNNAAQGDPTLLAAITQHLGGFPIEQQTAAQEAAPVSDPLDDFIPITDEEAILVQELKALRQKTQQFEEMFQSQKERDVREHQTRLDQTARSAFDTISKKYGEEIPEESRLEVCRFIGANGWFTPNTPVEKLPGLIENAYKSWAYDKAYQKGIDRSRQVDRTKAASAPPPSSTVNRTNAQSSGNDLDSILNSVMQDVGLK